MEMSGRASTHENVNRRLKSGSSEQITNRSTSPLPIDPTTVIEVGSDDEYDDNDFGDSEVLIVGESDNATPLNPPGNTTNDDDVIITSTAPAPTSTSTATSHTTASPHRIRRFHEMDDDQYETNDSINRQFMREYPHDESHIEGSGRSEAQVSPISVSRFMQAVFGAERDGSAINNRFYQVRPGVVHLSASDIAASAARVSAIFGQPGEMYEDEYDEEDDEDFLENDSFDDNFDSSSESPPRLMRSSHDLPVSNADHSTRENGWRDSDDVQIVDERRILQPFYPDRPDYTHWRDLHSFPRNVRDAEASRRRSYIQTHLSNRHPITDPSELELFIATGRQTRSFFNTRPTDSEGIFRRALTSRIHEQLGWTRITAQANDLRDFFSGTTMDRSIMERIERDNEREIDKRLESENTYNRKVLLDKKSQIKNEVQGYTSDISHFSNIGCELCGITLGEGIAVDFRTNGRYGDDFQKHQQQFQVQAPWFCCRQITEVEKDLSKRVFLAKCGHLYCGRCIKNIGNRPKGRFNKKFQSTIDDPKVYAPAVCPAIGCEHKFRGKKSFTELYF